MNNQTLDDDDLRRVTARVSKPDGTRFEGAEANNLVAAARVPTSMNNQFVGDHDLRGAAARVSKAAGNHSYTIIDSLAVDAGRNAPKTTVGAEDVHRVPS
ncbi:hypothetical protein TorRG33x02_338920 [Trema orientale]|uniref:Uncharacterized protein n=1 Tax=Trema orientale TaxID=63057 RepID=A0A2P5AX31_TREOI|nr:hypothetical protein TorRG33x02_338920 [Trema orientale]